MRPATPVRLRAALSVTIDTAAPAAPSITSVTDDLAPVTADVAGDGITNDNTPTLTGTAEANSTVEDLRWRSPSSALRLPTAAGAGHYTTAALAQGAHSFTATATDAAGSTGAASSAYSITIDTAAPAAPSITSVTMMSHR